MPEAGVPWTPHANILRFEETLYLCQILCQMGIRRIKLTGGEPLIRGNVDDFVRKLHQIPFLEQITLTTNGILLPRFLDNLGDDAPKLIGGVNISLNTLDPAAFEAISRRGELSATLAGLDRAVLAGIPVKLNCVPVRGYNERHLLDLVMMAKDQVKAVRFIELMPIGSAVSLVGIPMAEILELLSRHLGSLRLDPAPMGNGPAVYYAVPGFKGKIGFISALSETFCPGCNRLRLSSEGFLRACLANDEMVDLRTLVRSGAGEEAIKEAVLSVAASKPKAHDFVGSVKPQTPEATIDGEKKPSYFGQSGMHTIGG
jgi:cyclic pyranopterin phosphate synthase